MIVTPYGVKTDHLLDNKQVRAKLPAEYERRNKNLRILGFESYREYLQSDLWKHIRKAVLERDKDVCICCGRKATDVHHNSYELDVLVGKDISQLVSLCRPHHHDIEFDEESVKRDLMGARSALEKTGVKVHEIKRFRANFRSGRHPEDRLQRKMSLDEIAWIVSKNIGKKITPKQLSKLRKKFNRGHCRRQERKQR